MNASRSFLSLAALVSAVPALACPVGLVRASLTTGASTRPCSDPCLQAARAEFRDCTSSASGAFTDALDGCLARDHECVDACRFRRQDCRDGTGAGAELVRCQLDLLTAKADCRNRFPLGSTARVVCIDRAQVAGFQCRRRARRLVRRALRDCRAGFRQCAGGCGPGGPPGGVGPCRADGRAEFKAALATCKLAFAVTVTGCIDKNLTCTQGCGDARDACGAPTRATLDAAILACTAQERADVAACQGANPGGGPSLDQCVTAAQATAFTCRDKAVENAVPGSAACAQQFVQCVRGCPAGTP